MLQDDEARAAAGPQPLALGAILHNEDYLGGEHLLAHTVSGVVAFRMVVPIS